MTYGDADDISRLIVGSAIESDAVTYFVSDSSYCAVRVHAICFCRFDGEYDGDADAGVHYIVPPRRSRYCSGHRGACDSMPRSDDLGPYLDPVTCLHGLALLHASPHLRRRSAVASTGDDFRCSVHHMSLWGSINVRRCHVDFEDVSSILPFPWPVEQHCDCSFL